MNAKNSWRWDSELPGFQLKPSNLIPDIDHGPQETYCLFETLRDRGQNPDDLVVTRPNTIHPRCRVRVLGGHGYPRESTWGSKNLPF